MTKFELLPSGATQFETDARPLHWSRTTSDTGSVAASVDWGLHKLGEVQVAATDLFRICAGAYLADRLTSRGQTFTRSIELTVHVVDTSLWTADAIDRLENLLWWLTADDWTLRTVPAALSNDGSAPECQPTADEIALLSGGLDSLCGAVDRLNDGHWRTFVSHADGTTSVQYAQRRTRDWLTEQVTAATPPFWVAESFAQAGQKAESSSRSRSLLFAGLAIAVATARQARRVVVPENGYTSINPPLTTARGGALSTRSTHPTTFARINALLSVLGIPVSVSNPYQDLTKGELVARAAAKSGKQDLDDAIAATLSCGKLDGGRYRGGNPNYNCGLCVPCIVRRASIIAAGINDTTPYLVDTLPTQSRTRLISNRMDDILAVQEALLDSITEDDLLACGPWPDDFDLDAAVALCGRGLQELARVPLP